MCKENGRNGNGELTGMQDAWIEAYLGPAKFNATEAAKIAGYSGDRNALAVIGHRNLRKAKIAERIRYRLRESAMSADEVLARLAAIARADYSKYYNESGELDVVKLIADDKAHLIKSRYETKYGMRTEVYDSQRALETLAKHHGLLVERREVTGKDGGPIAIKGYRAVSPDEWPDDGQ